MIGCFQKPIAVRVVMMKKQQAILTLLLLLSVVSLPFANHYDSITDDSSNLSNYSEHEMLSLATDNWNQASSSMQTGIVVDLPSGNIATAHGTFDPLTQVFPKFPDHFTNPTDYMLTGMKFLQLNDYQSELTEETLLGQGIVILDYLGDASFLIRLPDDQISALDFLHSENSVRWVGNVDPGFRIHPGLLSSGKGGLLSMIPANDLSIGGYQDLVMNFASFGATDAWCGYSLCQAEVSEDLMSTFIRNIAGDGRIIWTEYASQLVLHNAVARSITGVMDVDASATFTLDGSGEMIAIADTGLDRDHPDINGRVAAVYTQFGLDPSPADTNSGHGTHVALSAIGDGSSDSSTMGMAPEASLTFYALEHDPTGVFGRQGSIYDMLKDAKQKTARIAINAWGLNGNYGEYTADSRSADQLVHDEPSVLPIFSVGDRGNQLTSQVAAPSTAKNVLSVGVSTTGTGASQPQGSVDNISSLGPTLDGRIKPDLVAPGIEICSGRAEEARNPSGFACGSGNHPDGDPLYMSLSGTSQSARVAGGVAALTREFLREQAGIQSPSAALIKAALINGAQDLGAADVPNSAEGWGQISLEDTILPTDGSTVLSNFYDQDKTLKPGFGLVYELDVNPIHGFEITLAWSDDAGSANSAQNSPKLINNLDLVLQDPSGNLWLGNNFASGFSIQGGTADNLNNVERISIPAGVYSNSGRWLVQVNHRSGTNQDFGLIMTADANIVSRPDLITFDGSIYLSSETPLENDIVSLRVSWMNQGTANSGSFKWKLEDLTAGSVIMQGQSNGLQSSQIQSEITTRSFSGTGTHTLQLSLDTDNQIDEMNDELNGVNNNIATLDIEVTALGVRVFPIQSDGTLPTSEVEKTAALTKNFDVRNNTEISLPITIVNEGTSTENVVLSYTNVQEKHPLFDYFISPEDSWSKTVSQNGPYSLNALGTTGDRIELTLNFDNEDSDLSDPNDPRYARSGTFYVDVIVSYQSIPTISHSIRFTIIIGELDDVKIVTSGTTGLSAIPGESANFGISAMNIGNSPAQYTVDCQSDNLWQIMLGNSNSSTLDFEPLDIGEFLPMEVRIYVPPVISGLPAVGFQDTVICYVTSVTDETLNFSETVTVSVLEKRHYKTNMATNGNDVGTNLIVRDILVDSGEQRLINYEITNLGNSNLDLEISIQPSDPSWQIELSYGLYTDNRELDVSVAAGSVEVVQIKINVPSSALEGDSNSFTLRAEYSDFDYLTNTTRLLIMEDLSVELESPDYLVCSIGEEPVNNLFNIYNSGNSLATLNWSYSLPPDGWIIGFSNPVTQLVPKENATVKLGIKPPINQEITDSAFKLSVQVVASNGDRTYDQTVILDVKVESSQYGNISLAESVFKPFVGIEKGSSKSTDITFRNDGNAPINGVISGIVLDDEGNELDGWNVDVSPSVISGLNPSEAVNLEVTISASKSVDKGTSTTVLTIKSNTGETIAEIELDTSAQNAQGNSGIFNILPWYLSGILFGSLLIGAVIFARKIKQSGTVSQDDGSTLVSAVAYTDPSEAVNRRESVLDIGTSQNMMTSGEVSQDEIAAALAQSIDLPTPVSPTTSNLPPLGKLPQGLPPLGNIPPGMPPRANIPQGMPPVIPAKVVPNIPRVPPPQATPQPPPLPPTGLPPGWTMEQWNAYGNMWLEKNK